ncbi:MAG: hypothetical protein JWP97_1556 [Labilithrix sp.]|nr:hypothetical protein [Labilithrix sp.]
MEEQHGVSPAPSRAAEVVEGIETDDRPTLPGSEVPTLPAAIPVPGAPGFDQETERFLSSGYVTTTDGDDEVEAAFAANEFATWWAAQRRRTMHGWVVTVMAVCIALLIAGAR